MFLIKAPTLQLVVKFFSATKPNLALTDVSNSSGCCGCTVCSLCPLNADPSGILLVFWKVNFGF